MSNSRWFAIVSLILGVVSCAAAIIVVPEVRCVFGLATSLPGDCRDRGATDPGGAGSFMEPRGATKGAASVDDDVRQIKSRFDQVERDQQTGRLDSLRKEVDGLGGDSAYATVYFSAGDIPKVRARVYEGDVRTSYQAYFEGATLVFVYRTVNQLLPTGPSELEQQRFYFTDGRLVRWLDATHREVPSGSGRYEDAEERVRALADRLLQGARASDDVIRL